MAGAAVVETPTEMKWYYPVLGLVFAVLVLAAAIGSSLSGIEDGDDSHTDDVEEVHEG